MRSGRQVDNDGRDDDGDDRDDFAFHGDHHGHADDEVCGTIHRYWPADTIDKPMASLCELLLELIYVEILIDIIDVFGSSHLI